MFELIIKKPDGSVYWTEHFNSLAEAQAWLAIEQTRSYWNASFTSVINDHTPAAPTAAQIAAQQALQTQIASQISQLKTLASQSTWVAADIQAMVVGLVKLKILRNEF